MKKIIAIFIVFISILFISSCTNNKNTLAIDTYNNVYLKKANQDSIELANNEIDKINEIIIEASYEYLNDYDYNGYTYEISYDNTIIYVSKYLTIIKNDKRLNYSSSNHTNLITYLEIISDKNKTA